MSAMEHRAVMTALVITVLDTTVLVTGPAFVPETACGVDRGDHRL